jgi:hypothetical protein
MLALSVAIQSKEIAEGARRDSSALKSLNILAFLFFPPTYIAVSFLPLIYCNLTIDTNY